MRFYLGVSVWGSARYLAEAVAKFNDKPLVARFFLCFPYLSWSDKTLIRTLGLLRSCGQQVMFGLDSGGFVQQVKLKNRRKNFSLENYKGFLKDWGRQFEMCLSWDYGDERECWRAFKTLISSGFKVTPVWKLGDNPQLLIEYVKETPTEFVAVGGFGMLGRHNAKMSELFWALRDLIGKAKETRPEVKFHALGCGFNTTLLKVWVPESADSTTPLQSQRYGLLVHIRNGKVVRTWYRQLRDEDLPSGVCLSEFKANSRLRSVVTAWCALKVTELINLSPTLPFALG